MTKTIFISDLHLSPNYPDITQAFNNFLTQQLSEDVEALYILGDLFESYVGDDEPGFIEEVAAQIKKASCDGKLKIYLMRGNRDFLIGEMFAEKCNATLLPDPCIIDLYGDKTLLSHGDSFCTNDKSYQRFKRIVQSSFFKFLAKHLPLSFRLKIANYLRGKSKAHTKRYYHSNLLDVSFASVKGAAQKYQIKQIIHGHTHRPRFHAEDGLKRWVLPDWQPQGGMLSVSPQSSPQLVVNDKIQL